MRNTYLLLLLGLAIGGCATTASGVRWNDATVAQLEVGMVKSEVISMFGNPTSKSSTASGEKLIFKRQSDESQGRNAYIAVVSLGGNTGANATVIDFLEISLEDGLVSDYEYTENTNNSFGGF